MPETVTDLKLPLLDLRKFDGSPADRAGFLASLKVAARDVGFFYLTGHGVSDALTSDVLALGFAGSVAMWSVGYLGNLPAVSPILPSWALLILMLACLFMAAFKAGQLTGRGWLGGLWTALISAVINLLMLGALWEQLMSGTGVPSAAVWIGGYFLLSAVVGILGGAVGRTRRDTRKTPPDWLGAFSWVAVAATLLYRALTVLPTLALGALAAATWRTHHPGEGLESPE